DNRVVRKIRAAIVKGVFDLLDNLAQEKPDAYRTFYVQFGSVLKEGLIRSAFEEPNSAEHRDRIAKLLRFASSRSADPSALVSLEDYLARMPEGQKRIYYLGGPDYASVVKSPNLEIFRRRGLEVLFLTEPIDEFAMTSLRTFQGKELTSIDSAELDLPQPDEAGK